MDGTLGSYQSSEQLGHLTEVDYKHVGVLTNQPSPSIFHPWQNKGPKAWLLRIIGSYLLCTMHFIVPPIFYG